MTSLYFSTISDKVLKEQLSFPKNTKFEYRMTDKVGTTEYTIVFTNNKKAAWIAKYKGTYYGNVISHIVEQDRYSLLDVFKTLRENAQASIKALKNPVNFD